MNLDWLALRRNELIGEIPAELGSLANLRSLALSDNQLTGTLPAGLAGLSNLESLDLGGNELTGPIPAWLGDLVYLQRLDLENNQLTGEIPAEVAGLLDLRVLNLGGNGFTGSIPVWLGDLASLRWLDLSDNQLTGEIPAELGNLDRLERLYLAQNQLTGCIPGVSRGVAENDLEQLGLPFCDVLLSGLHVSPGSLVPQFDPYRIEYSAAVGLSPVTVTVIPANDHNATILFLDENDLEVADADDTLADFQIDFGAGIAAIKIKVVSQDSLATHTYAITDLAIDTTTTTMAR